MPIFRYSLADMNGLLVHEDPDTGARILNSNEGFRALVDRLGKLVLPVQMFPGVTEITPPGFSAERSSRHFVNVHSSGETATYIAAPRTAEQQIAEFLVAPEGSVMMPIDGALRTEIPRDERMVNIASPDAAGRWRLNEIIFCVPANIR
ncbi:MAG TPA: hypothetical protein VLI54_00525 [Bacillota bacterium]|nr:hypothetical protein [Bacillota bacterium]